MSCGLYGQYPVESDSLGWPTFFSDQEGREQITKQIRDILVEFGPLDLRSIYEIGRIRHDWKICVAWDGIFAVIERAARNVAEPVWKLKD
jgi:hypothetical protein